MVNSIEERPRMPRARFRNVKEQIKNLKKIFTFKSIKLEFKMGNKRVKLTSSNRSTQKLFFVELLRRLHFFLLLLESAR